MRRTVVGLSWLVALVLAAAPAQAQPPPLAPGQARLGQTVGGLDGPGSAIAFSDRTGLLAAATENGSVFYWDRGVILGIRSGDGTPNVLVGHEGPVLALAWDGTALLASGGADQKIRLWSMPEGKLRQTLAAPGVVRTLALSADGKTLASAGDGGTVQLWDVDKGKPSARLEGHTDWVLALCFSPDGKTLASGGYDGVIRFWDVDAGKKLREAIAHPTMPPDATNIVAALAFSPDGKQLAVGGSDAQIHLLNVADGKLVRSMPGHTSSITGLVFHPSGTLLASSSKDRTVRLWNPANGQALKTLEGHTAWVQGIALVAQGTRLASVGADETVRFWELR